MDKRYRDEYGRLTIRSDELSVITKEEGLAYYTVGEKYLCASDNRIYECVEMGENIITFTSGKFELSIDKHSCGTFLPDIASEGMELTKV